MSDEQPNGQATPENAAQDSYTEQPIGSQAADIARQYEQEQRSRALDLIKQLATATDKKKYTRAHLQRIYDTAAKAEAAKEIAERLEQQL